MNKKYIISKEDSYQLRGIAAIGVIVLHFVQVLGNYQGLSYTIGIRWGEEFVGIFLMLSGYGMTKSLMKRQVLTKEHVIASLGKLIVPFLYSFFVYLLLHSLVCNYNLFFADLVRLTIPQTTTWFFKVILGIYIVHMLVFHLCRKELQLALMFIICGLYVLVMKSFSFGAYWWNCVMCYPVGMAIASYKQIYLNKCSFVFVLIPLYLLFSPLSNPIINSFVFSLFAVISFSAINKHLKFLIYLGKNSYIYYLVDLSVFKIILNITGYIYIYISISLLSIFIFSHTYILIKEKVSAKVLC